MSPSLVRVLLVDDDEDFAVLLDDYLSDVPGTTHHVDWIPDYERAVARLVTNEHSVCLLDYRLGARTGLDLLREARRGGSRVPVILLTGQGGREIDLEAMQAGAFDYLGKGNLGATEIERAIRYAIDRNASERALVQASKLAAVGEMASMVAHEVNNPVGVIVGKLRLLLSDSRWEFADKVRSDLTKVLDHAHRIGTLTRRLLDFSRPAEGARVPIDLGRPLALSLDMLEDRLKKTQIDVWREFEPGLPLIQGNVHELQQVFVNLLMNAADAMAKGGSISIRTYAAALATGAPAVAVDIEDSGGGIPAELQAQVFEPFFSTKREGQGTGLGLAISRRIVAAHQGTLGMQSVVGAGTTFTITLPQAAQVDR